MSASAGLACAPLGRIVVFGQTGVGDEYRVQQRENETGQQYGDACWPGAVSEKTLPLTYSATELILTNQTGQNVEIHCLLERYVE